MKLNATAISVRSVKPKYAYGQVAALPVESGTPSSQVLVRVTVPADIPDDAVVTKADLVWHTRRALTGSRTISTQRNAAGFAVSTTTWNTRPTVTGTVVSTTVGAGASGREVRLNVLNDVQGFVAGTAVNNGWRITTSDTNEVLLTGSSASSNKPYLELEYVIPSDIPVDLSPNGAAVSVAAPTVTATVPHETVAIQVQIDPASNEVAPAWDSGEVAAVSGLLNLAATTYPGLANGAGTSWRMRAKNPLGWGGWSDWAAFTRTPKTTVTITSPAATTGDPTPPVTWTAAGQVAWQVIVTNAVTGALLAKSNRQPGTDTDWTPPKGLTKVGQVARITVRVWDNVDRVATAGDPDYAEAVLDSTLVAASAAPGVTSLTATSGAFPYVRLAWNAPDADAWQIERDGKWYKRIADGSVRTFVDNDAKPGRAYRYRVLPVGDSGVGNQGPSVTHATRPPGLWLVDEDGAMLFLADHTFPDLNMDEQAVQHDVINGATVRRRYGLRPPWGSVSGTLVDGPIESMTATAMADTAFMFKASDAGRVYRMVHGDQNLPVTIGDVLVWPFDEKPLGYEISFRWWQTDDELLWGED